jgi:HEAT repeat protein
MIPLLLRLLCAEDPVVAVRAADVLEKAQRELPASVFSPFRTELLALARTAAKPELRWHLAQMLPRLLMSRSQRREVVVALERYFSDRSAIVRVSALQAIVELSENDRSLEALARDRLDQAMRGSAAERARARLLLAKFFGITAG